MKKRIITILLTLSMIVTLLPAMSFAAQTELPSVDDVRVCHTPSSDYRGGDCVLTSCKNMLRRFAVAHGSMLWTTMTNKAIRPYAAPSGGLKYTFNYSNDGIKYTVKHGYFKSKNASGKIKEIEKLLKKHKEGIIVWGSKATKSGTPHGVLAVSVRNGVVYAIDSAYNTGKQNKGALKWSSTIMGNINKCTKYWCISETKGSARTAAKSNAESTLCISGVTAPSSLTAGKGFSIYGDIDSNYIIHSVVVEILNSKGKVVISQEADPDSWFFDVHSLDSKVKFGTLAKGKYTYRITASDEKKTQVLYEEAFKVKAAAAKTEVVAAAASTPAVTTETITTETAQTNLSSLKIKNATEPGDVRLGKGFDVRGIISSNKKIASVKVSITDQDGNEVQAQSAEPKKKSYDLINLDKYIKFGSLALGNYTYTVSATDSTQTLDLVRKEFTVVKASTLKIKSYTYPENIEAGKSFTITGKIKSNKKISKVWITITDESGKKVISVSAKPKKKSYNLKKLDSKVKFGKLAAGKYTYKVTAKDSEQKLTLVKKTFTVN